MSSSSVSSSLKLYVAKAPSVKALLELHPETLLPVDFAALILNKSSKTLSNDVTRRPNLIPKLTRVGGRVFFRLRDVHDFINGESSSAPTQIPKQKNRKVGRPSNLARDSQERAGL